MYRTLYISSIDVYAKISRVFYIPQVSGHNGPDNPPIEKPEGVSDCAVLCLIPQPLHAGADLFTRIAPAAHNLRSMLTVLLIVFAASAILAVVFAVLYLLAAGHVAEPQHKDRPENIRMLREKDYIEVSGIALLPADLSCVLYLILCGILLGTAPALDSGSAASDAIGLMILLLLFSAATALLSKTFPLMSVPS